MPISKHHYAEELAKENDVWFLQPPRDNGISGVWVGDHPTIDRLHIVSWQPLFPRKLRFHFYGLYKWLMGFEASHICRGLNEQFDLVWSFDFNLFPDLRVFGASRTIFHPVDPLSSQRQVDIGRSADLILSVSDRILSNFDSSAFKAKRAVINHGIGKEFLALANAPCSTKRADRIKCGYFGNLDRRIVNADLIKEIALNDQAVEFHFWGKVSEGSELKSKLSGLRNCHFHGAVDKHELVNACARMDCFVFAYRFDALESDRSNAHKLLEYFCTGKVVISTRMDCYDDEPDLIQMTNCADDSDFSALFSTVVSNIEMHNSISLCEKRKSFAQEFTYPKNLQRIDLLLSDLAGPIV